MGGHDHLDPGQVGIAEKQVDMLSALSADRIDVRMSQHQSAY
jgi:hypothetical protein